MSPRDDWSRIRDRVSRLRPLAVVGISINGRGSGDANVELDDLLASIGLVRRLVRRLRLTQDSLDAITGAAIPEAAQQLLWRARDAIADELADFDEAI